jgi:predicted RNA-binding protein with PIN domain
MGKGDGKKKRKKKSTSSSSQSSNQQQQPSTSSSSSQVSPLRVSTNINIPVKRQIKWAKLNQEYIKKSSQTSFRQVKKTRTAFRKRLDDTEQTSLLLEKRKRNSNVDWDVILKHGNGTSTAGPLMLVDGYNVIYQWSRLQKHMVNGNTQRARELLVRDLEELHNIKGWRIECVFDGFGRKVGGALSDTTTTVTMDEDNNRVVERNVQQNNKVSMTDRQVSRTDTGRGVRIVYSGVGASADSYIESRCLDAKSITGGQLSISGGSLIVVSNDAMIRMVATGAGALCMSSDRLVDELKSVKKVTNYRVEVAMAIANGGYVRPEKMRKNGISTPMMQGARGLNGVNKVGITEQGGRQVVNTFRGGQFIIEDKRKKKKGKKTDAAAGNVVEESSDGTGEVNKRKATMDDLKQGTQTLPSWAVVPKNATKFTDR